MGYTNWRIADFKYLVKADNLPLKYLSPILYAGVFATKVTSALARPTWKFGGSINVLGLGSNFPGEGGLLIDRLSLPINKPLLVNPSEKFEYYQVEIDLPRWFPNAEIIIWQADSDEISSSEIDLKLSQNDFQSIMDKLNNLPNIEARKWQI